MAASATRRPALVAVLLGVAGAVVATVLGFLTFGAQATAAPHDVPLAVSSPPGQLREAAERVAQQGGDAVDWQVTDPERARELLADKEVYGILELGGGPRGVDLTVVTSGAVSPQGTQAATQVLTGAAQGLSGALSQQGVTVSPPNLETVDPASVAARTAPLAASALLWIAGLVAALGFGLLVVREGMRPGPLSRATLLVTVSVVASAVVAGFVKLWDSSLPLGWDVLGFVFLSAVAFAAVQGALLRIFRLRAVAILGPLYLIAPAVASQVPEMLNPAYRTLLWSWTPFRFSTEGLRSLLLGTADAPDVRTGLIVLGGMAIVGLVVMLWPGRTRVEPPVPAGDRERALAG
ncbi:YhgE/Pip domain-containing protein [Actinophytocola sp.]|uniref:YhgE/Pip domain-containing protein n=1 Tax=Actinophytocola sp. TaxID=1872138 RepID=UPI003D6B92DE